METLHFYQFVIKLDLNFINLYLFRRNELEKKLEKEDISDERKNRQLQSLGRKESSFLRLRRTRLGLEDFVTVKVIGKGAFGEVCRLIYWFILSKFMKLMLITCVN